MNIEIEITRSKEANLKKALFTIAQIKSGFYQKNQYLISTDRISKQTSDPKYIHINSKLLSYLEKNFNWESFDQEYYSDLANPVKAGSQTNEIEMLLDKDSNLNIDLEKIQGSFQFLENLYEINQLKIKVFPVSIGTISSFKFTDDKTLEVYARFDINNTLLIYSIVNAILTKSFKGNQNWSTRRVFLNYLFTQTKLKEYIDQAFFAETYLKSKPLDHAVIEQSNEYYIRLGFTVESEFKIKRSGEIVSSSIGTIDFLTSSEEKALKLLLQNKGKLVDFAELSIMIWGNKITNKYSLEAMAKIIERLRHKLKAKGIRKEIIFTKRGEGYLLSN